MMKPWFKEKICDIYYTHGLFCASHPYIIITIALSFVCLCCYPLTNLPYPGNAPLQFETPVQGYVIPTKQSPLPGRRGNNGNPNKNPLWYSGPSLGYVQQIVVKATVSPWQPNNLIPSDAFRGPLSKIFDILDLIDEFQYHDGDKVYSVHDLCYQVHETTTRKGVKGLLPEYNCLVVSPVGLWGRDRKRFKEDSELIKTLYQTAWHSLDISPLLKDILFGVPWKETGVSRFFFRNRQRIVSFAVTIVYKTYNEGFVRALREKLEGVYPAHKANSNSSQAGNMVHIYYKDVNYFVEYTPLLVTYVVLFLYILFSVRKIEMVKSKWGLALSAVATVVASLFMSIGICTFFGLQPILLGSEIFEVFPYLVVIVGLENVLVLTKSVVSTPATLSVKERVARGLYKEGWSITKNLVTELLILLVGFFTFVPAIQEFCLFAVVGLLSDFYLQMLFFSTVLSIDIRRMELSETLRPIEENQEETADMPKPNSLLGCPKKSLINYFFGSTRPRGHRSHWPTHPTGSPPHSHRNSMSEDFIPKRQKPKRLRVLYFLGDNRVAQRLLMICTVIWIALIVYKTGLAEHVIRVTLNGTAMVPEPEYYGAPVILDAPNGDKETLVKGTMNAKGTETHAVSAMLEHDDMEHWKKLSNSHWPSLFGFYNISLLRRYFSLLPSTHLSIIIDPKDAIALRNPAESKQAAMTENRLEHPEYFYSGAFSNIDLKGEKLIEQAQYLHKKFYPQSRKEFLLTVSLALASAIVVVYFMTLCYGCMCSRNYPKMRRNMNRLFEPMMRRSSTGYKKIIKETVPLVLAGHQQEVECMEVDGPFVISTCLGGEIRVWDSNSGDCLTAIHRKGMMPPHMERKPCPGRNINDSESDLYDEFHGTNSPSVDSSPDNSQIDIHKRNVHDQKLSSPGDRKPGHNRCASTGTKNINKFEFVPDLSSTVQTDFSAIAKSRPESNRATSLDDLQHLKEHGYDFGSKFDPHFQQQRELVAESREYEEQKEMKRQRARTDVAQVMEENEREATERTRSYSTGDQPSTVHYDATRHESEFVNKEAPPIWCLACRDNLIVVGCGNGRIEFWDALEGKLKCLYASSTSGVTGLCFVAKKIIAARMSGIIDFLELETFSSTPIQPAPPPNNSGSSQKIFNRGHFRMGSGHRFSADFSHCWNDIIHCTLHTSIRAHQLPITSLQSECGRVVSASQDHTLKVFRIEECLCLYTLHGHMGCITALELDKSEPLGAASGDENGSIRLWELLTGKCIHKMSGHSSAVTGLACTPSYIVSTGLDERLCVWQRSKGTLMYNLELGPGGFSSLSMLTSKLMVGGSHGGIELYDISRGQLVRSVQFFADLEHSSFVQHLRTVNHSVVICDYGNQLRITHFPQVLEKVE
ncbi:sterol regulatory element-binding protein cleavage-activating protein-like [Lineus longissimus]|uniref:sterol regulatory element-binding protein cleavage-activating protein-like n=1 Tax=Lineus longissimus TaxID=88925 RepID=UPI002B4C5720